MFVSFSQNRVQNVCRYGIITTKFKGDLHGTERNGKAPDMSSMTDGEKW